MTPGISAIRHQSAGQTRLTTGQPGCWPRNRNFSANKIDHCHLTSVTDHLDPVVGAGVSLRDTRPTSVIRRRLHRSATDDQSRSPANNICHVMRQASNSSNVVTYSSLELGLPAKPNTPFPKARCLSLGSSSMPRVYHYYQGLSSLGPRI